VIRRLSASGGSFGAFCASWVVAALLLLVVVRVALYLDKLREQGRNE